MSLFSWNVLGVVTPRGIPGSRPRSWTWRTVPIPDQGSMLPAPRKKANGDSVPFAGTESGARWGWPCPVQGWSAAAPPGEAPRPAGLRLLQPGGLPTPWVCRGSWGVAGTVPHKRVASAGAGRAPVLLCGLGRSPWASREPLFKINRRRAAWGVTVQSKQPRSTGLCSKCTGRLTMHRSQDTAQRGCHSGPAPGGRGCRSALLASLRGPQASAGAGQGEGTYRAAFPTGPGGDTTFPAPPPCPSGCFCN